MTATAIVFGLVPILAFALVRLSVRLKATRTALLKTEISLSIFRAAYEKLKNQDALSKLDLHLWEQHIVEHTVSEMKKNANKHKVENEWLITPKSKRGQA